LHATNDCNVFRQQIQSAIDDRRLVLSEMQVDKTPFPVHTLELNNPKVLLWSDQAKGAKGKNVVIIGDPRPMNANDKVLAREVIAEKTPDGKPTLRIIVNAPKPGGQGDPASQPVVQARPVGPVSPTGQTGSINRSYRIHQPVRPVQSSTPDFQTEASGRGYLEDECTKAAGKVYKSGTYLWAATKQVHKGRSTRSAIKKETTFTTASRQCFTSKEGIQ